MFQEGKYKNIWLDYIVCIAIKNLIEEVKNDRNPNIPKHTTDERWKDVGKIVMDVQKVKHRHHTIIEKFEDLTIKPVTGIPIAIIVLFLTFAVVGLDRKSTRLNSSH